MITRKPRSFLITYESGVTGEFADPVSGIPFYRLKWPQLKKALHGLAEHSGQHVTLTNSITDESITVSPEGDWS